MTNCRMADMRNKEVISIKDGTRLGAVNDIEIELKTARISAIIIYGRLKWLGLLGREDDIVIRWEEFRSLGRRRFWWIFRYRSARKSGLAAAGSTRDKIRGK